MTRTIVTIGERDCPATKEIKGGEGEGRREGVCVCVRGRQQEERRRGTMTDIREKHTPMKKIVVSTEGAERLLSNLNPAKVLRPEKIAARIRKELSEKTASEPDHHMSAIRRHWRCTSAWDRGTGHTNLHPPPKKKKKKKKKEEEAERGEHYDPAN